MCQYINIVLPENILLDAVKPVFVKHGFSCKPFQNISVLRQVKYGSQLVSTTSKYCDCDSVIGSAGARSILDFQTTQSRRLKSKGWTQTKINNWLASKSKTNTQAKKFDRQREQWTALLKEIIIESNIRKVGLYIHWYAGTIEEETITFECVVKIPLSKLMGDRLDNLKHDVLYEFSQA